MQRAPTLVAITGTYLGLSALGIYAWLWHARAPLPGYVALVCALPLVLHWLVTRKRTLAARERILRSLVCFMFLPFALASWALSGGSETTPEQHHEPDADSLRSDELLVGAIARQDIAPSAGQSFSGSGATFADGSELRISHFAHQGEAENYLKLVSDTFHATDTTLGTRTGKSAQIAANLIVYWELHGQSLLEVRAGNELLVRTRIETQHVPSPPRVRPAPSRPAQIETSPLLAFGAGIAHMLLICLFVLWAAAATTRVSAQEGIAPLSEAALLARIEALPILGLRCSVESGASEHERVIQLHAEKDQGRAHRLTVTIDAPGRVVRSVEVQSASGVAPRTEDEAQMRAIGDPSFGVLRPRAQKVWNVKRLATPIEPARLASLSLSFANGRPQLPEGYAAKLDDDGIIHLVCALVISAGFDYQPVLWLFQGASRKP